MSVTVLSKDEAIAGVRLTHTPYQWFTIQLAERVRACAGTHMVIRMDCRNLTSRELRRIRRTYKKLGWSSKLVADQNDGKVYLLLN